MTSYVLVGDSESKKNFLSSFIEEENIKTYNLFDYKETLKIPQVREIKKLLSTRAFSGAKRLFVIRDATLEAQNALLKTLEELPEDTSFIFLNEAMLIPTILSRARVLNFKGKKVDVDANLSNMLGNFLSALPAGPQRKKDLSSAFIFVDKLFSQNPNLIFSDLIIVFREILFEQIKQGEFQKALFLLTLLKSLCQYVPLIESNNLNKRFVLEKILLRAGT
ncbi:MAG: hypothetical protein HY427_00620 [Candidatus Levybacteria bacterium]|nr:hypothetical protein [Candidatus Levybacteria bacterium]